MSLLSPVTLAVIAKEPVPGRVKTRLTPPCTPQHAAMIAEAALRDTFAAVMAAPALRRICVLDGSPGAWLPAGVDVMPQVGGGLDERLAAAFGAVDGPMFLIGMDTPQITASVLANAAETLASPGGFDAVLGMTHDGGYWGIGLRHGHDPDLIRGVPMSRDDTGAQQLDRLLAKGLTVDLRLPVLTDVDHFAEARTVAREAPGTYFAAAVSVAAASLEAAA
ncbi:MAG: DUF2064 domain-containing protein [Solirubrobacteraceae bacterium]|nr:DUF2064 domain-containing protein [Solirubrobacteraceae bacterium]